MKSETMASLKYMLAVLGLAVIAAGKVLTDHADKIDAMDDTLPQPDSTNDIPQITHAAIAAAELDSNGLPWDERIHAGTKSKNQDGSWKKRKGVPEDVMDAVTAELRALYPATKNDDLLTGAATTPQAVTTPAVPAVPVVPAVPAKTPYTELCDFLAKNTGNGHALNDEWIAAFFAQNGTSLPALATELDKSAALLGALRGVLSANGIAEVA